MVKDIPLKRQLQYLQHDVLAHLILGQQPGFWPVNDVELTNVSEELALEKHLLLAHERQLAFEKMRNHQAQESKEPEGVFALRIRTTPQGERDQAIFHAVIYKEVALTLEAIHWGISDSRVSQIVWRQTNLRMRQFMKAGLAFPCGRQNKQPYWRIRQPDFSVKQVKDNDVVVLAENLTLTEAFRKADEINGYVNGRVPLRE